MAVNNIPTTPAQLDKTNSYFNNFFVEMPVVATAIDQDLLIFFEKFTGNKDAANILASSVISTAKTQQLDLNKIMDELRQLDADKINVYLTLILNMNRVNTSLLGVLNTPPVSQYVSRTVRP